MTAAKIVGLLSAALGALGTLLLFFGSFAYEQPSPTSTKKRSTAYDSGTSGGRQCLQRAGLGLLMLSFVLGGVCSVRLPSRLMKPVFQVAACR